MADEWQQFERIVRRAKQFTEPSPKSVGDMHSFDQHNIHQGIVKHSKKLFDDKHYVQATLEAYKFIEEIVQKHARSLQFGANLMKSAFDSNGTDPPIKLTPMLDPTQQSIQKGYKFLFSGAIAALRNPLAHSTAASVSETREQCLDHLVLASMLLRRLEESGFNV